jgi:hypothetical protein
VETGGIGIRDVGYTCAKWDSFYAQAAAFLEAYLTTKALQCQCGVRRELPA